MQGDEDPGEDGGAPPGDSPREGHRGQNRGRPGRDREDPKPRLGVPRQHPERDPREGIEERPVIRNALEKPAMEKPEERFGVVYLVSLERETRPEEQETKQKGAPGDGERRYELRAAPDGRGRAAAVHPDARVQPPCSLIRFEIRTMCRYSSSMSRSISPLPSRSSVIDFID